MSERSRGSRPSTASPRRYARRAPSCRALLPLIEPPGEVPEGEGVRLVVAGVLPPALADGALDAVLAGPAAAADVLLDRRGLLGAHPPDAVVVRLHERHGDE